MRIGNFAVIACMLLAAPSAMLAQEAAAPTNDAMESAPSTTLQQRLMPESMIKLVSPAPAVATTAAAAEPAQPAMPRGSGTGLIIAGGALFVAGLLIGGDPGTLLAVTGAAVGAYGLYLYFN